jgi:hypothetical protein
MDRPLIRHNECVGNIPDGVISGIKGPGKTSTTILKASRQKHRSWQLYSNEKMACNKSRRKATEQSKD